MDDTAWMQVALAEARLAAESGEVPVGAAIVLNDELVSRAHNLREGARDPTAHAEILAIREASRRLGRWRLSGCTLYVTLEPCAMCAGAIVNARVDRVVYGARDPRAGAVESVFAIAADPRLNHRAAITAGVAAADSSQLLREFFLSRRS